jgi:hypothetical protein
MMGFDGFGWFPDREFKPQAVYPMDIMVSWGYHEVFWG